MTGLGREFFYASAPAVETGTLFASHCPSPEASTQTILGGYHDHSIIALNVTRPELVTEVKFLTWTEDNLLRQVVYEGLREDKPARDVRRPVPHRDPDHRRRPVVHRMVGDVRLRG